MDRLNFWRRRARGMRFGSSICAKRSLAVDPSATESPARWPALSGSYCSSIAIERRLLRRELGGEDHRFHVLRGRCEEDLQVLQPQPHFDEVLFVDRLIVRAAFEGEELFTELVF